MTRINTIDPSLLSNPHLVAEYKELPRVFNLVRKAQEKGKKPSDFRSADEYRLGKGHVLFFYTRLWWLVKRYDSLVNEMKKRGYKVNYPDPFLFCANLNGEWFGDWRVTKESLRANISRLKERDPEFYEQY